MKYLLNVSVDIYSDLNAENFRGEGRWERNVLNALLTNNKTVHTTRNVWKSSSLMPSNLYDGLNEQWMQDSTLLVHGAGRSLFIERDDAKAYIVQFHETPFGPAKKELQRYVNEGRMVATVASYNKFIWGKLAGAVGNENIRCVQGAMVPFTVDSADNFRKPNVTWMYRNFRDFIEEKPNDIALLFNFLRPLLQKELEMRVVIVVGLWDTTRFGVQPTMEEIRQWALSFPVMQQFTDLFDRIDFCVNLHWKEVLDLLGETRWIISPAEPLGCPAYEAAMFGIPTIVNKDISPFVTLDGGSLFSELLTSSRSIDNNFINLLSRLQNNHSFYRKTGDAYRDFTKENASFESYTKQLEKIVDEKGWNK